MSESPTRQPMLSGCSLRCCGFGFAFVQSRWLLIYIPPSRVFRVELVRYLIWSFLWCAALLLGWLCFSHSNPNPFAPGGIMFDLWLLCAVSYVFGNALSAVVCLPPLFGYMIVGMILRNLPEDPTTGISKGFGEIVKEIALTIIVSRAGLGLPVNTFLGQMSDIRCRDGDGWRQLGICKRASDTIGRLKNGLLLAVTPMTLEAATYAPIAMAVFGFDIYFGFLLGFVMAAVSPAVVVPGLIDLQARGFVGGASGTAPVPSIVMFASGLDDIFAITLFGIFFGMSFGGGAIVDKVIKAPCEIVGGVIAGFLLGSVLFYVSERLVPKSRAVGASPFEDPEAAQVAYAADVDRFGVAHAASPVSEKRLAESYKSHLLVFLLVFLSSITFVIGFAHVEVGEAGDLTSLGVLGAMSALFALNYHFSQAEFQLSGVDNDIQMLEWTQDNSPDLEKDKSTRDFFSMTPGQSLLEKIDELNTASEMLADRARRHNDALTQLNINMKSIWDYAACPMLFSLVGRSIVVSDLIDPDVLPKALGCLALALFARCVGAIIACTGSGWPWLNRFFVAFAWLPKATVQAAVGGLALGKSEELWATHCAPMNLTEGAECEVDGMNISNYLEWSKIILQLSVVGILVTAPLGAAAIALLGPRWLGQQNIDEAAVAEEMAGVVPSAGDDTQSLPAPISPKNIRRKSSMGFNTSRRRSTALPPVPEVMEVPAGRWDPFAPAMGPQFSEDYVAPHLCDHPAVMHLMDIRIQKRKDSRTKSIYAVDPQECDLARRGLGIQIGSPGTDDMSSPKIKRSASFPCSFALRNPSQNLDALPTVAAAVGSPARGPAQPNYFESARNDSFAMSAKGSQFCADSFAGASGPIVDRTASGQAVERTVSVHTPNEHEL